MKTTNEGPDRVLRTKPTRIAKETLSGNTFRCHRWHKTQRETGALLDGYSYSILSLRQYLISSFTQESYISGFLRLLSASPAFLPYTSLLRSNAVDVVDSLCQQSEGQISKCLKYGLTIGLHIFPFSAHFAHGTSYSSVVMILVTLLCITAAARVGKRIDWSRNGLPRD